MSTMSEPLDGPPTKRSRLNDSLASPNDNQGKDEVGTKEFGIEDLIFFNLYLSRSLSR